MQTQKSPSTERVAISDGWLAMGTFFEVDLRVHPDDEALARTWIGWARSEISRLEELYSRHDPVSALSALNRSLAREEVLRAGARIDAELESMLFAAIEVWEATGGAFDITVGPLVEVWREAVESGRWPSVETLRMAKRRVGAEGLLMMGGGELQVAKRGMRLDLDGMSKGAVLDRLRERFEKALPGAAALFSFGESSILALGDPGETEGGGWRLMVRPDPASSRKPVVLRLRDRALSASSSIGQVSQIAGEQISHVIDPRTGSAIAETVEAIVVAERATIADAWSTALLVVGANRSAIRLLDRTGLEAKISDSAGRAIATENWEGMVAR